MPLTLAYLKDNYKKFLKNGFIYFTPEQHTEYLTLLQPSERDGELSFKGLKIKMFGIKSKQN
jgi:hypothetical protein